MSRHIHFVGIGGAGLSALAKLMLARGEQVSGSDLVASAVTKDLEKAGAKIFVGHAAENIAGADVVVITSAAQPINPEIIAAHSQQIPILKRREFLREVTAGYDTIAVAGSHGKTTTTALIATILSDTGQDPSAIVGGIVPEWNTNARSGSSKWFVIEADEYDYAFLGLEPEIAVVTNVDYDHPDLFPTRKTYDDAFAKFMAQTRGLLIVCGDDSNARNIANASDRTVETYGLGEKNEWRAVDVRVNDMGGTTFTVQHKGEIIGVVSLQIPGKHNVVNALAAVAVADRAGVSFDVTRATLSKFEGVKRRFQIRGQVRGAIVLEDYAHHPTELRATLSAARMRYPNASIWALFQPHTYSRTRALLDEFAGAFDEAQHVIVTEIYAAREQDDLGMSGEAIVQRMNHPDAHFVAALDDAAEYLMANVKPGDVIVTLGAGSVTQVASRLVENHDA